MPRGRSNREKTQRVEGFRILINALHTIPEANEMLRDCAIPSARMTFERLLETLVNKHDLKIFADKPLKNLFDELLAWTDDNRTSPGFEQARLDFRTNIQAYRKVRRLAAETLLVDREVGATYITSLPTVYVSQLSTPYPPPGMHISESPEITAQWHQFCHTDPLPDPRRKRSHIHELDPACLQRVIGVEESCKLVDKATHMLIAVVIRDLTSLGDNTNDPLAFRQWATEVIADGIKGRKSIRLEDPGKMIQTGYSAGARSKPVFNWVRNVISRQETSLEFLASSDFRSSCLFALGWNICRSVLPHDGVMKEWVEFLDNNRLPRMDGGVGIQSSTGNVTIHLGDTPVTFHNMELAPASGLLNQNYARGVHREQQPHPFAVQWILHRSHGEAAGGHFYIAEYGVKIINVAATRRVDTRRRSATA
ncbi:hypothetical protein L226DRAFT_573939 [Lentinus tigrinus ALCF2SS1-7]|uniref:uncharacterized protein n=1 Tax=Lentinus tigrinus ALCF2SS1-7 TaxID=1328758 RepID=UPI001165F107|nr:hypothetical protein L226DRAFT_573939 [Lentinus tigrinus ALCF2SS1-7]